VEKAQKEARAMRGDHARLLISQTKALWYKNVLLLWRQKGLLACIFLFPLLLIGAVGLLQLAISNFYVNPPSNNLVTFAPQPLDDAPSPSTDDPFFFEYFYVVDNTDNTSWIPIGAADGGLLAQSTQWNFTASQNGTNFSVEVPFFINQDSVQQVCQ